MTIPGVWCSWSFPWSGVEPFLRLDLLAVQDDGDGQDVDEQTPGAMSICDESEEDDDCWSDYGGDDSDGDSGDDDGSDEEEQEEPPRVELQLEAQRHLHREVHHQQAPMRLEMESYAKNILVNNIDV